MTQKRLVTGLFVTAVAALFLQTVGYSITHKLINLGWWGQENLKNLKEVSGICFAAALICVLVFVWKRDAAIKYLALLGLVALAVLAGLPAVTALLLLLCAALSIGDILLKRRSPDNLWSDMSLAICLGLAAILTVVSISAHWRVNYSFTYLLALTSACLMNIRGLTWHAMTAYSRLSTARLRTSFDYAAMVACGSLLSLLVFFALMPTMTFDSLVTHLWLPEYIKQHQVWTFDYQSHAWAVMPLGCDWLYTAAVMLGGEGAARLLDLLLACLGCIMVAGIYARHTTERVDTYKIGIIVFLLLMSAALDISTSVSLFDDNLLLAAYAATLLLLMDPPGSREGYWAFALGLLLGAAAASKLMGVLFAGLCGLAAIVVAIRSKGLKTTLRVILPVGITTLLVVGSIPYVYAWYKTGNPVFPFFNAIFASPYYPRVNFEDMRWVGNNRLSMLFDMTFDTSHFVEAAPGALGFQYWVFLPLALIWVAWHRYRQVILPLLLALIYIVGILVNEQYLRYLYPIFPLLLGAIALFVVDVANCSRLAAWVTGLCCVGVVALNVLELPSVYGLSFGADPRVVLSDKGRERFLETYVPGRVLTQKVNSEFGATVHLLLLTNYDVGAVGLEGSLLYNSFYNPQLEGQLGRANSDDDVLNVMRKYSVTHVLFTPAASIPNKQLFAAFLEKHAKLITSMGGEDLYQLDTPSIFANPLIQNSSFKGGLSDWVVEGGHVTTDKMGATLQGQTVLGQNMQLRQSDIYYFSMTVTCQSHALEFHVVVDWRSVDGKVLDEYSEPYSCMDGQEQTFSRMLQAPAGAQNANVFIADYTPYSLGLSSVLLQSGNLSAAGSN